MGDEVRDRLNHNRGTSPTRLGTGTSTIGTLPDGMSDLSGDVIHVTSHEPPTLVGPVSLVRGGTGRGGREQLVDPGSRDERQRRQPGARDGRGRGGRPRRLQPEDRPERLTPVVRVEEVLD